MSRRNSVDAKVSPAPSETTVENETEMAKKMASPVEEVQTEKGNAEPALSGNGLGPRKLGLWDGVNVIVSLMIGSGIFCHASQVDSKVGSSLAALVIWIICGLLTLNGALCYAELGTMIPGSGGEAQYLAKGYGPLVTYLFDWTNILIIKPVSVVILMQGCVGYSAKLLGYLGLVSLDLKADSWPLTVATCVGSLFVAFLASRAPDTSQRLLNVLTWSKLMALATIILGGFLYLGVSKSSPLIATFTAENTTLTKDSSLFTIISAFGSAMNAGLWSFDGWNNLNMVAGDLKNPKRNLPLSIWISVSAVLCLYSVTLVAYYCVISRENFVNTTTVGTVFGEILSTAVFGDEKFKWIGSSVIALFVIGSTFSAALSSMITSAEVILLSAENENIPAFFGRLHPKWKTAANAYALQGVLAVVLAFICNDQLLEVYTFPVWIFYALCSAVVLILRFRAPELERPYRVYITTPILFLFACAILVVSTAMSNPLNVLGGVAVVLAGVPVYYWIKSRAK